MWAMQTVVYTIQNQANKQFNIIMWPVSTHTYILNAQKSTQNIYVIIFTNHPTSKQSHIYIKCTKVHKTYI